MAGMPIRRNRRARRARRNPLSRVPTPPVGSQVVVQYYKSSPSGPGALVMTQAQLISIGENDIEDDVRLTFRLADGSVVTTWEPGRGVAGGDPLGGGIVAVTSVPKNPPPRPPQRHYSGKEVGDWLDGLEGAQRSRR